MISPVVLKPLAVVMYTLMITNLANVMTIQKEIYLSSVGDGVILSYSGSSEVYVLTSQLSEAFDIKVGNTSKEGTYSGVVHMRVIRQLVDSRYNYLVALYSTNPFTTNITVISGGKYLTEVINCPPNVTIQLIFSLVNNFTANVRTLPQIPVYLSIPLWNLTVMLLVMGLFTASAVLDIRDYSRIKRDRWGVQESVAVVVKYLLYGFLISFILSAILTIGITIYMNVIYRSFSLDFSWLLTLFIILIINVIAYQICKWKGWYDVVDEE